MSSTPNTKQGKPSAWTLAALALFVSLGSATAQTVKQKIALNGLPAGIAVNYVTNKVYVAVPSFGGSTDSLVVIDGASDRVASRITIPAVGFLVAADVLNNRILIGGCTLDTGACSVVVVDGKTNKVLSQIPVTQTPGLGIEGLAVDPVTGKIFVANASDGEIDVLSYRSKAIVSRISTGSNLPFGLAVNVLTCKLFAALGNGLLYEIDTRSQQIVKTGSSGTEDVTLAINYQKGTVFVPDNTPNISTVGILDADLKPSATVPVGVTPYGVDVDFVSNLAFVVNTQSATVSVIDAKNQVLKTTVPLSGELVSVDSITHKAYVTGQDASVTVITEN